MERQIAITRERIPGELNKFFENNGCGKAAYFLTLNTRIKVYDPKEVESKAGSLRSKIDKIIEWLNKYCFGEKFGKKLFAAGFFEYGDANNLLHCHLLLATKEVTRRTVVEMGRYLDKKWETLLEDQDTQTTYQREEQKSRGLKPELTQQQKEMRELVDTWRSTELPKYPWEFECMVQIEPVFDEAGVVAYVSKQHNKLSRRGNYCNLEFF